MGRVPPERRFRTEAMTERELRQLIDRVSLF